MHRLHGLNISSMSTEKKCAWIENMISIETDGFTRPCCGEIGSNARIAPISDGILNSFNHPTLLNLKENLNNGFSSSTRPYCYRCENLENLGLESLRTNTKFLSSNRELKMVQFKMSNKCQLACLHCGPSQSSTWAKKLNVQPRVKTSFEVTKEFLKELSDILPNLEVIKFTGGEPFLDPDHWKILEYLKDFDKSHCEIHYITNGLAPYKSELWKGWKSIKCSVSVDGFEESFEWFRRGAAWNDIVKAVEELKSVSEVEINYSITPYTIQDFLPASKFWNTKIKPVPIVFPKYASLNDFPSYIVESLEDFQSIPFYNYAKGNDLKSYVEWANHWDNMWETSGWADKLFYWVKNYNDRYKASI
jgi:organic radical activating enzyme